MFILFGTRNVASTIEKGTFVCPNCKVERPYALNKYRSFFTLFFIPLIPIKTNGTAVKCMACSKAYVPDSVLHLKK